jgi:heat shock protein HslJ
MKKVALVAMATALICGFAACKSGKSSAQTEETKAEITNKRWKLVELNGAAVTETKAFIVFKADGTVSGNLGCNTFNGVYTRQAEVSRIKFDKLVNTQKMCFEGMDTEDALSRVLQTADNYNLTATTLTLNRARMAPLARFEAEYVK